MTQVKDSGANSPSSLDQMGPSEEENHLGGLTETEAIRN